MKIAVAICNQGDGSCSVVFFDTVKNAEARQANDNERFCDDVYTIDLPFDESKVKFHKETEPNTFYDQYFSPAYYKGEMKLNG